MLTGPQITDRHIDVQKHLAWGIPVCVWSGCAAGESFWDGPFDHSFFHLDVQPAVSCAIPNTLELGSLQDRNRFASWPCGTA